jgi:hypothetical protein
MAKTNVVTLSVIVITCDCRLCRTLREDPERAQAVGIQVPVKLEVHGQPNGQAAGQA